MYFALRRHVWVRQDYGIVEYQGFVLEWLDDDSKARVIYAMGDRFLTEIVPAFYLRVVDSQPNIGSAYG